MRNITKASVVLVCAMIFSSFMGETHSVSIESIQSPLSDSLEKDRAKYVALILEKIKGKENLPVDSVFKGLKIFKEMPAKRLLAIMNFGYSRSLGVSCGHCHNTNDFASEEKKEKEIARQMSAMNKQINDILLKNIQNLESNPAIVNCTTCHRGQIKPALDLPPN